MKEQYVGDVNDFRKYALLRQLGQGGQIRIGVCWMLTPDDGSSDGNLTDYQRQPERWREHDPELFDLLCTIAGHSGPRRLRLLERSSVIPKATYFDEFVPRRSGLRQAFFETGLAELAGSELVFFDPDNGLDVASVAKGREGSPKFIYRDEVAATYARGHSVLLYQHFPREDRERYLERLGGDLAAIVPDAQLWCFRTAFVAFLLAIRPQHQGKLGVAAEAAAGKWPASFITGGRLRSGAPIGLTGGNELAAPMA